MGTFLYFGYGSNMLSQWLGHKTRCPSCKPIGVCVVESYALSFDKLSVDTSGKATIIPSAGGVVYGRLFEIDVAEQGALDRAEGSTGQNPGYTRDDAFAVIVGSQTKSVTTYIGRRLEPAGNLKPFDWYLALVVAGALQSGLPSDYVAALKTRARIESPAMEKKDQALAALKSAGFKSIEDVLKS